MKSDIDLVLQKYTIFVGMHLSVYDFAKSSKLFLFHCWLLNNTVPFILKYVIV